MCSVGSLHEHDTLGLASETSKISNCGESNCSRARRRGLGNEAEELTPQTQEISDSSYNSQLGDQIAWFTESNDSYKHYILEGTTS